MSVMKAAERNTKGSSAGRAGFISTGFLIVMCMMMNLISLKCLEMTTVDKVFIDLQDLETDMRRDAMIAERFKCMLIRNEKIADFECGGISVMVFADDEGYVLYYDDMMMQMAVNDRQIVDMILKRT